MNSQAVQADSWWQYFYYKIKHYVIVNKFMIYFLLQINYFNKMSDG
jgi:hypothetical protein